SPAPPGAAAAPPGAGTAVPPGAQAAAPGLNLPPFAFDINRLSRNERIIGIASLILLISGFLPWDKYGGTETLTIGTTTTTTHTGSVSFSGYSLHGYLWIVFILSLVVVAFLVMKAGWAKMPFRLPIPDDTALLVVTGLSFVLVLIGFLTRSYGGGGSGSGFGYVYKYGWSWSYGSYIGLIAAVVAVAPLAWPLIQKQMNKGAAA
ncbi:MAG: hypothetical protein ACLP6E_15465, partial [Acidimicrobiales bacterium]